MVLLSDEPNALLTQPKQEENDPGNGPAPTDLPKTYLSAYSVFFLWGNGINFCGSLPDNLKGVANTSYQFMRRILQTDKNRQILLFKQVYTFMQLLQCLLEVVNLQPS